jgi:hypothetical protein
MRERKGHKLKTGWRRIPESRCEDPSCEFFGKPAQQGVCFSRLTNRSTQYIDAVRKYSDARMAEVKSLRKIDKKLTTDKQWIKYLEANLECCWMNEEFTLDQLIHLRAQVGKLTNRLRQKKA